VGSVWPERIVQSVFRRFLVKLLVGDFDLTDPRQLIALLVAIGRNRIADEGRDRDNWVASESTVGVLTGFASSEKTRARWWRYGNFWQKALEGMTPQERQILEQYVDGVSWRQIGREHGVSADAGVRSSIVRANGL